MSTDISRKVYTVQEVAMMLNISRSYTYELLKAKRIPVLQLGTRVVIPKKKFDEWLEGASQ